MEALGFVHGDLAWRHVGLLPKFGENETIMGLRAVFIDMEYVCPITDEHALVRAVESKNRMLAAAGVTSVASG
jgi:hypothetical protein